MAIWQEWVEVAAQAVELLAVVVMLGFIGTGTVHWLLRLPKGLKPAYDRYRVMLARSLLLGLELLVAADIIRTVIIEPTLGNLVTLSLLVVVRTALGWSLTVEIEGRWPWQAEKPAAADESGRTEA